MQEHLQILYELYRTEPYGPWHTRECLPWEYDVKIQECIRLAQRSESRQWFLDQAKIFQVRTNYLRHEQVKQSEPSIQPITQQSSKSLAKTRRNQKTRQQYKKRRVTVQIQEVDHIQEVDSLGAWNKPGKHVVLQRMGAWECCWHTVVQSDWTTMVAGMMIIEYEVNWIRRLGIG